MIQIGFKESNVIFNRPLDCSEDECGTLEAYSDGTRCISCWCLSKEEINHLLETRRIWLYIMGGQPPVSLTVYNPFDTTYRDMEK